MKQETIDMIAVIIYDYLLPLSIAILVAILFNAKSIEDAGFIIAVLGANALVYWYRPQFKENELLKMPEKVKKVAR